MTKALRTLDGLRLQTQYRTGENDPVDNFYRPCLEVSVEYKRAVGYFRSSIFSVVGTPVAAFARRGGRMRLICSPSITEADAEAMAHGYSQRDDVIEGAVKRDLDVLLSDAGLADNAKLLATLVKCGSLDVKLAFRPGSSGIYHEKLGIFIDAAGFKASFLGSANETWNAWHPLGNHESTEVFRAWVSASEGERVESHNAHFERLWHGEVAGVATISFPSAQKQRLIEFAGDSTLETFAASGGTLALRRTPLPFQAAAIDAWKAAGRRGVLQHATGSGKTVTAMAAIREHVADGRPAVVLVPSQLLLLQWKREMEANIPEATLLLAGAGHVRWKTPGRLRSHTHSGLDSPRIVLATMQTAASDKFLADVSSGDHLLLVADEVHQIGSTFNARSMAIASGGSLGLSATPQRYGDPTGTQAIFARFGPIIDPVITLQDAIDAGRLVSYEYYPHPVHLSEEESVDWRSLTREISLEIARTNKGDGSSVVLTERAKLLLIKRSRIAKKASVKPGLAAGVIKQHYRNGQKWLVYCEDLDQVAQTLAALQRLGLGAVEYHTKMSGDRAATLEWFKNYGGVLVSIKCLDEGVDIPSVTHAFILASSQNPRQFIQRRGRVLRWSDGKDLAVIHDVIVVPVDATEEQEQLSLLRAELARAVEFSESALNLDAAAELRGIALKAGIEVERDAQYGFEEEVEEL